MFKRIATALGLGVVLFAFMLFAIQVSYAQEEQPQSTTWPELSIRSRIDPALLKQLMSAPPGERIPMIVVLRDQAAATAGRVAAVNALRTTAERSQRGVRAFLTQEEAAGHVEQVRSFWIFNGLALRGVSNVAWALAARPDVEMVKLDQYRQWVTEPSSAVAPEAAQSAQQAPEWGIRQIRADLVWNALNITGTGVVVANMDSGVDFQHPALNANYRGNTGKGLYQHNGNWFDATPSATTYPSDGLGHGTHTMGILAGQNGIGVAPGASWMAAKVLDNQGYGLDSWIHAGFQWLLAPNGDPALAPDLVSNSWGYSDGTVTTFQADLDRLHQADIFVVFSVGNNGPSSGTVSAPASLPGVLAVGATDANDEVAYFSSRGPSPWGEIKPVVAAPGVRVRSSVPGGAYAYYDGTSMASPYVAGVAALMLSGRPDLSIAALAYALTSTVTPLGNPIPNNATGWGRVDAYRGCRRQQGRVCFPVPWSMPQAACPWSGHRFRCNPMITVRLPAAVWRRRLTPTVITWPAWQPARTASLPACSAMRRTWFLL